MSAIDRVPFGCLIIDAENGALFSAPAPVNPALLLRAKDLPGKPLFHWSISGQMWLPVAGSVIIGRSAVAVSAPNDTNEDILATITVPGKLLGPNGQLRVSTLFTVTNSANNKTLRARLGGAAGTAMYAVVVTTTVNVNDQRIIANRGAQNSQIGPGANSASFGQSATAVQAAAIDTSVDQTIVLSGQKATAGETITLESYLVEAIPGE